jgi:glycosyltransferase involved in cell wall biosynthesis
MGRVAWCILTGEYPPQHGGVSDYTRVVAKGLAEAGDEVHVWAPRCEGADPADAGVTVHRLPDHYGRRSLRVLGGELDRIEGRRILVQYLPHAYGRRAMNVSFCLWLYRRASGDEVWTLFHEVAHPLTWRQPVRHNVLAVVQRLMAAIVARASSRIFVTIPGWRDVLAPLAGRSRRLEWMPVPTTLPTKVSRNVVDSVRAAVIGQDVLPVSLVIGHFGTYGPLVSDMLESLLPHILASDGRCGLLMGRGSREFAMSFTSRHPGLAGRICAIGDVDANELSAHIAACDLVVQPYPDGVSTRRTSVMASLALEVPVVTVRGDLTESVWSEVGAVALAGNGSSQAICAEAERVINSASFRRELADRGKRLYDDRFDTQQVVACLRGTGGRE